jgi:hypothetical protein
MFRLLAVLACFTAITIPVAAGQQGKNKNKEKHQQHEAHGATRISGAVEIFIGNDQRMIREYVRAYPGGGLPPGLAKRNGALPPGLEKQLRRKGHLPPGLEKKLYPFAPELERRLSPLAPGLSRGFIAGRAVIYNSKTSAILDVFVPLD